MPGKFPLDFLRSLSWIILFLWKKATLDQEAISIIVLPRRIQNHSFHLESTSLFPSLHLILFLMMWNLTLFHLNLGLLTPMLCQESPSTHLHPGYFWTFPQTFPWPGLCCDCTGPCDHKTHTSNTYQRTLKTEMYYSHKLEGTGMPKGHFWMSQRGRERWRGRQRVLLKDLGLKRYFMAEGSWAICSFK